MQENLWHPGIMNNNKGKYVYLKVTINVYGHINVYNINLYIKQGIYNQTNSSRDKNF